MNINEQLQAYLVSHRRAHVPFPFGKTLQTLKSGKQKQKNLTYLQKIRTVTVGYYVQAAGAHGGVKYSPPMM